jgi:hypothetical protein
MGHWPSVVKPLVVKPSLSVAVAVAVAAAVAAVIDAVAAATAPPALEFALVCFASAL